MADTVVELAIRAQTQQFEAAFKRITTSVGRLNKAFDDTTRTSAKGMNSAFDNMNRTMGQTTTAFRNTGRATENLRRDTEKLRLETARLNKEKQRASRSSSLLRSGLGRLAVGFTAITIVVRKAIQAFRALVKYIAVDSPAAFRSFEHSIAKAGALIGSTSIQMQGFQGDVQRMSAVTGRSSMDLSRAFFDIVSAGNSAADAMKILETSGKLATGGFAQTADTADALTGILSAYGLAATEATRVSDILFQTQKLGKTTISELAQSIGNVTPIAAAAGVELTDLGAALATLTQTRSGSGRTPQSVTALRALINSLLKPTKGATKLATELGIEWSAAAVRAEGFGKFIQKLQDRFRGLGEGTQLTAEHIAVLTGRIRATTAALSLIGGHAAGFNRNLKLMDDHLGTTEEAFKLMSDTGTQKLDELKNAWEIFTQTFGKSLAMSIQPITQELTTFFNELTASISAARLAMESLTEPGESSRNRFFGGITDWVTDANQQQVAEAISTKRQNEERQAFRDANGDGVSAGLNDMRVGMREWWFNPSGYSAADYSKAGGRIRAAGDPNLRAQLDDDYVGAARRPGAGRRAQEAQQQADHAQAIKFEKEEAATERANIVESAKASLEAYTKIQDFRLRTEEITGAQHANLMEAVLTQEVFQYAELEDKRLAAEQRIAIMRHDLDKAAAIQAERDTKRMERERVAAEKVVARERNQLARETQSLFRSMFGSGGGPSSAGPAFIRGQRQDSTSIMGTGSVYRGRGRDQGTGKYGTFMVGENPWGNTGGYSPPQPNTEFYEAPREVPQPARGSAVTGRNAMSGLIGRRLGRLQDQYSQFGAADAGVSGQNFLDLSDPLSMTREQFMELGKILETNTKLLANENEARRESSQGFHDMTRVMHRMTSASREEYAAYLTKMTAMDEFLGKAARWTFVLEGLSKSSNRFIGAAAAAGFAGLEALTAFKTDTTKIERLQVLSQGAQQIGAQLGGTSGQIISGAGNVGMGAAQGALSGAAIGAAGGPIGAGAGAAIGGGIALANELVAAFQQANELADNLADNIRDAFGTIASSISDALREGLTGDQALSAIREFMKVFIFELATTKIIEAAISDDLDDLADAFKDKNRDDINEAIGNINTSIQQVLPQLESLGDDLGVLPRDKSEFQAALAGGENEDLAIQARDLNPGRPENQEAAFDRMLEARLEALGEAMEVDGGKHRGPPPEAFGFGNLNDLRGVPTGEFRPDTPRTTASTTKTRRSGAAAGTRGPIDEAGSNRPAGFQISTISGAFRDLMRNGFDRISGLLEDILAEMSTDIVGMKAGAGIGGGTGDGQAIEVAGDLIVYVSGTVGQADPQTDIEALLGQQFRLNAGKAAG